MPFQTLQQRFNAPDENPNHIITCTMPTYLSINGKCKRSVIPASNGFTILRKRDGGVGVFTIGNELKVPLRVFRIEFGV